LSEGPSQGRPPQPASAEGVGRGTGTRALWWLAALGVVLGVVVVRVAVSGHAALERGRAALAAGDELLAAVELRESVSWALPALAPWREEAAQALWDLAERQAAEGRQDAQVQTLSQLRAGWLGGRGLLGPDTAWLHRVDEALAPALAAWEAQAARVEGRPSPGPRAARVVHFAEVLARDPMPNRWGSLAAALGFAAWLLGAWRAAAGAGGRRWAWLGVALVGLVAFLLGAWLA